MISISKVFQIRVSGKRVPLKMNGVWESILVCFCWRASVPIWLKKLNLEWKIDRNSSVSLSLTLTINKKVKHYIRIKTHRSIVLKFWIENDVNFLCGWTQVSLVLYLSDKTLSVKSNGIKIFILSDTRMKALGEFIQNGRECP